MNDVVKNRSEILFLYDVTYSNPNGDPVDENKPRIDEETGINLVTDVRLKRTIRDYLHDYRSQDIFIFETRDDKGNLRTKEDRLADFKDNPKEVLSRCIDVRLFGATTAVKGKTITLTGPVQFKYGRSLHKVDLIYVKGTTVMPSKEDKRQGTFTEKYILPYSLIVFYGIINENAARNQNIDLTESDVNLLLEAMWNGTKNLISASKVGQMPRLLLQVIYKEGNFYVGELDKRIQFVSAKDDREIRDIVDGKLEIGDIVSTLESVGSSVEKIRIKVDERVVFTMRGVEISIKDLLGGFIVEDLNFDAM
ncbi:MAG: type I-B CRISPR-associated protein Cas7/Csh2 [Actinobacteria bacterium]|nr:type I-B CRISPR-associated protein Cas7/Csh2 [Actinomycetota bacterium]